VVSMKENSQDIYPFRRKEILPIGIRYNPFNPGGESDLHKFFVDRDDAISRIINQFEEIINEKRMKTFFIMGEEGLGKTSILRVLEYEFGKGFKKELESRINKINESMMIVKDKIKEIKSIKKYRDNLEKSLKDLKNYKDSTDMLTRGIPDRLKERIEDYFEAKSKKREKIEESLKSIENYIRISILKGLTGRKEIPYGEIEKLLTFGDLKVSWKKIVKFCQENLQEVEDIIINTNNRNFDQLGNEMAKIGLKTTKNSHEGLIQEYDKQISDKQIELENIEARHKFIKKEYEDRKEKFESLIITDKSRRVRGRILKDEQLFMRTMIDLIADKANLMSIKKSEDFFRNMVEKINHECKNRELVRLFQNKLEKKGYNAEDFVNFYAFNGTAKKLLNMFVEASKKCDPRLNEEEVVLIFFNFFIETLQDFFTAFLFLFDDATHFGGKEARGVRNILVHLFRNKPSVFVFAVNWTNRLPVTYGELFSRFGEPTDLTKPAFLTKADCEKSIRLRLESARIEEWQVREPFEPFSVAVINEIVKESSKVPIFWVYMCYHALEILRNQISNGETRVTVEMAKEAIQNAWSDIIGRMSENERTILFALAKFKNLGKTKVAEKIRKDQGNTSKKLAKFKRMQLLTFKNIPRPKPKTKKEERERKYQLSYYKTYSIAIPSLEKFLRDHEDECPFEFSE
jgi:hypothetical protein